MNKWLDLKLDIEFETELNNGYQIERNSQKYRVVHSFLVRLSSISNESSCKRVISGYVRYYNKQFRD